MGFGLGYSLSRRVAVDLSVSGWVGSEGAYRERLGALTLGITSFPLGTSGAFVTAGAGVARFSTDTPREFPLDDRDAVTGQGLVLRIGAGYDLSLAPSVALSPFVTWYRAADSEIRFNGESSGLELSHRSLQVGVSFSWNFSASPFALEPRRP